MATRMQHRRGTAAEWAAANPILADGELGFERDTGIIKVGNGSTLWNQLPVALNSQFLPVLGKAFDAERLDGLDSTAFVKQTDTSAAATANTVSKRDESGNISYNQLFLGAMPNTATAAARRDFVEGIRREPVARTVTASTTLALTDEGGLVSFNGAAAVACTVPANATVAFPIGSWVDIQTIKASAPVTITAAAGVTIRTPVTGYSLVCLDAYAPVRLLKIGTDEWMPIAGTVDTGIIASPAVAPWPGNMNWRVKNGISWFSYVGVSSGAIPANSEIFTLPVGARPPVALSLSSVYAETSREINVFAYNHGTTPGRVSSNKAQSAASGMAVTGSFPVVVP